MKNKWNTLRLSWFPSYSATPSVTPSDLFWARALSCKTSITGSKMNELGLVSVLCLLFAKAAGAPKHWEHLQTESNEAAGHIAAHSSCTNQSCWPLKGPRRTATSYRKLHSYLLKSLLASRKWSSVASFRAHSNRNTDWLAKLWQSLVTKDKGVFPDCVCWRLLAVADWKEVYGAAPKPPCDCFGQYQIAVASIVCMKSSEYFQITFQLVTKPEKVSNVFSLYNFPCKLWVTASEQNNHNKVFGAASSLPLILPSDSQQHVPNWLERTHFSLRTGSYKHSLTSLWSTE